MFTMENSLWASPLNVFDSALAEPRASPAAGSAAAVSARFAVSLVIKILAITKARVADGSQIDLLIASARRESGILAQAADDDSAAFATYLDCIRNAADEKRRDLMMLKAIEVPLNAARSAVRVLGLSREAALLIPAFLRADLGAAVLLLSGCVRALLMIVDYNLKQLSLAQPEFVAERISLARQLAADEEVILSTIG